MKRLRTTRTPRRGQQGYALLMVIFFAALLFVGTMSVGLRVLTEGKRQKEQEMIWRGKQYTRAIKMYYRKLGRFPNSLDDLSKPKIGTIRFLRQPYTDPMNKDDGSWRLIYVGAAGQLIGSLKPPGSTQFGMPGAVPGAGTGTNSSSFGSFGSSGGIGQTTAPGTQSSGFGFGSSFGSGTSTTPGANPPAAGTGAAAGSTTSSTDPTAAGAAGGTNGSGADASIPSGDTPTIVGGNVIGIGSKINQHSIIVYEQATNYRQFEFIWNPSKDLGVGQLPGAVPGAPGTPGAPGQPGTGQAAPGQGTPGQGTPAPGQPGQGQPGSPANPNAPQQPPTSDPNSNPNPQQQQ